MSEVATSAAEAVGVAQLGLQLHTSSARLLRYCSMTLGDTRLIVSSKRKRCIPCSARLSGQASRILRSGSDRHFHAFSQNAQNSHVYSENFKGNTHLESSILGNLAVKLGLMKVQETVTPYAPVFRSYIHSGQQTVVEAGRTYRSMDFVQGIIKENGNNMMGRLEMAKISDPPRTRWISDPNGAKNT
ncbi:Uncharacterized protein Fot_13435 [Forsythia ovata]|uniref:Uncharacterized protein n=1 Tax=Forsythia ovata TaxID=205694 RepID=A0ABD1W3R7_9LAMI